MKIWHRFCRLPLCFLVGASAVAAEIQGSVRDATDGFANIITASELVPNVGDKVEIFFKIPGGQDEVAVASARVSKLNADSIEVRVENMTGTVAKGQLARITTENPGRRQPPPVSPSPATKLPPPVPGATADTPPAKHVNIVPPGTIPAMPPPSPGVNRADVLTNQGLAKFNAGDIDGAIADFDAVVRLMPDNGLAYFNRATAHLSKGNMDQVIADADKAITLGIPNPADAFVIRGTARASKGDVDGAIADCDRAIKADPKHALAYNNRANDRMLKRDWKGGLADANKALTLNPNLALGYYNRGFAHANMGDHAGAIADWNKAIALQPGYQAELGKQIEISRSKQRRR